MKRLATLSAREFPMSARPQEWYPIGAKAASAPAEYPLVDEARKGIVALGDGRHRQRVHGAVMLFAGMAGLGTSMLMGEVILMTIVGAGIGGYGLYLCRR